MILAVLDLIEAIPSSKQGLVRKDMSQVETVRCTSPRELIFIVADRGRRGLPCVTSMHYGLTAEFDFGPPGQVVRHVSRCPSGTYPLVATEGTIRIHPPLCPLNQDVQLT